MPYKIRESKDGSATVMKEVRGKWYELHKYVGRGAYDKALKYMRALYAHSKH
jgi:hypothetical protein